MIPKQLQRHIFRFCLVEPKTKKPIGNEWQNKGYIYNDPKLQQHIRAHGNIGILFGFGDILGIDCDSKETEEVAKKLPLTFTIQTNSGGKLMIFVCKDAPQDKSYHIIKSGGEVRIKNSQSLIPPSEVENKYKVVCEKDITSISWNKIQEVFGLDHTSQNVVVQCTIENYPDKNVQEIVTLLRSDKKWQELYWIADSWRAHGYTSRSEAEMGLCCFLASKRVPAWQVNTFMKGAATGKWCEATANYRETTLLKAYTLVTEKERAARKKLEELLKRE